LQFAAVPAFGNSTPKKYAKEKKKKRGKRGHRGHRGFLGQQGAPGSQGSPGAPGAPGAAQVAPFVSVVADENPIPNSNPQQFYNTQIVPVGDPILFDPATFISDLSGNILLSSDGSTFTINTNGFYEIIFGCFYTPPSSINHASITLTQISPTNLPLVTTFVTPVDTSGGAWAQSAIIINQTTSPSTYQILNDPAYSTGSITLQGINPNGSDGAFITIKRIAS